jgi:pimeloyl-[acyl-carrier protein] synthase
MKKSRVRGETTLDVLAMLREPARLVDPYPLYAELRQRSRVRLPTGEIVLSRYADVVAVLKDPMFRKPPLPRPPSKATRVLFQMFLLLDPPDHTRLRRVVAPAFAPAAVARLRSTATLVADRLIASVPGTFDLVGDFAYPLPLAVIGELLGVPDVDRAKIGTWSRTLTESIDDPLPLRLRELPRGVRSIVQGRSHPVAAARAAAGIVGYAKQRMADAAAGPVTEFLETLDRAQHDGVISADEACATWIMMVIAGHETTANLIGNSVLALLEHPDLLARIRNDPTLMSRVVDECLRYDSPVPYTGRTATEVTTINGTRIERGQTALVFMAAANRDPDPFPDPDRLDLARPQTPPHLGFASGIHFCVGSALAKLETEIALTTLLPRLASDLHREEITRRPSIAVRGIAKFPLQLAPSASTGSAP